MGSLVRRSLATLLLTLVATLATPAALPAQSPLDWRPPTRTMPEMPRLAELSGDWLSPRAAWFHDVPRFSGVEAAALVARGERRARAEHTQLVRFSEGALPIIIWLDRNGDSRCDMMEIYRRGGLIIQLIDADYDGEANVVRTYDAEGKLIQQRPL